jgi:hypothetical protein
VPRCETRATLAITEVNFSAHHKKSPTCSRAFEDGKERCCQILNLPTMVFKSRAKALKLSELV